MSKLLDEIKYAFSNIDEGKAWPVETIEGAAEGWLIREKGGAVIAALPSDLQEIFDEKFANIHMRTSVRTIDGTDRNLIIIECESYAHRDPFCRICEDFLNAENGPKIAANPKAWWKQWKELVGNTSGGKSPHAVIGELILVHRLMKAGLAPEWTGPEGGSHDLETENLSFEVKSTTKRVDEVVTISSQHQLSVSKGKKLFLALCRFEPNRGELSINSLAGELVREGFDEDILESRLKKLGYPVGRTSRAKQYGLLEAQIYAVDADFPKITPKSFKGETFPEGVVKMVYDISLSNLQRVTLDDFITDVTNAAQQ